MTVRCVPGWDLELGDVCQPFHIQSFCMEVAIDQVLARHNYLERLRAGELDTEQKQKSSPTLTRGSFL